MRDSSEVHALRRQRTGRAASARGRADAKLRCLRAGEHLDEARAEHADDFSRVPDRLQCDGAARLIESAANRRCVVGSEGREIEAFPENEYIHRKIAAAADRGHVVTARAAADIGTGNGIESARKNDRRPGIGQRIAGTLREWPALPVLAWQALAEQ